MSKRRRSTQQPHAGEPRRSVRLRAAAAAEQPDGPLLPYEVLEMEVARWLPFNDLLALSATCKRLECPPMLQLPQHERALDDLELNEDYDAMVTNNFLLRRFRHMPLLGLNHRSSVTDAALAGMPALRDLHLYGPRGVTDAGLAAVAARLQRLYVCPGTSYFCGITDAGFRPLVNLTALTLIGELPLTGAALMSLTRLVRLDISRGVGITDAHLAGLVHLQELYLVGTQVTGHVARPLTALRQLSLTHCPRVSDATMDGLANVPWLYLNLRFDTPSLTGAGLAHLTGVRTLALHQALPPADWNGLRALASSLGTLDMKCVLTGQHAASEAAIQALRRDMPHTAINPDWSLPLPHGQLYYY